MLNRHMLEILDSAELDVQEDVIWDYIPYLRPNEKCFAFRVNRPFEEACSHLARFYIALGGFASGLELQNMESHNDGSVETVEVRGWDAWQVDSFPKYGRGEEPYTVFYFPKGELEG